MFKLTTLFQRALLALALTVCGGAAVAGPTYHVNINTTSLAGTVGYIDFSLLGLSGAAPVVATLSNFSGAFGAEYARTSFVTGAIPGSVLIGNEEETSFLTQAASFGGIFGFDLNFGGAYETTGGPNGSSFALSLFNDTATDYVGSNGAIALFELVPAFGNEAASVSFTAVRGLAEIGAVAQVPEPSELLLMLTGLGLLGATLRRRAQR